MLNSEKLEKNYFLKKTLVSFINNQYLGSNQSIYMM